MAMSKLTVKIPSDSRNIRDINSNDNIAEAISALSKFQSYKKVVDSQEEMRKALEMERIEYSKLRNNREKATFFLMMHMSPEILTNIRKEFFVRGDVIKVNEFIYIINKHLVMNVTDESKESNEFCLSMFELFKEIDVNGDGDLEWQEFTAFTVDRANVLTTKLKKTNIAHFHESTEKLDRDAKVRHRHDISRAIAMTPISKFAMVEENRNSIFIFDSRYGNKIKEIFTESAPVAIEYIHDRERDILIATGTDMTMSTYSLDDPNPNRRYQHLTSWSTPGVQMSLAFQSKNNCLYSGSTNYNIYLWNIKERNLVSQLQPKHTDIVMSLANLSNLDNIVSASLDKTICVWDSYTNDCVLDLHGHRKGIFNLAYSSDYRLLISCGFEHDAFVWSPFIKNQVCRLKGHNASLIGCVAIDGSSEIITGDTNGIFKLWDVRTFSCIQTFSDNSSNRQHSKSQELNKMSCFFHTTLPSRNSMQKEDDSRMYAASKSFICFDQIRVIDEAITDKYNVFWIDWNDESWVFVTVSEKNVILWDGIMGSKTTIHTNIAPDDISACCLDNRKRKIVIGDIHGFIGVYNLSNGALMKEVRYPEDKRASFTRCGAVVSLNYVSESRRFIAGFSSGIICVYDESTLDECSYIREFDVKGFNNEMINMSFNPRDNSVITISLSTNSALIWNYQTGKLEYELKPHSNNIGTVGGTRSYADRSRSQQKSARSSSSINSGSIGLVKSNSNNTFNKEKSIYDDEDSDDESENHHFNEHIVHLSYMYPYPLIVTTDSIGNVTIWGSVGCRSWSGVRIAGFLNQSILSAVFKDNITDSPTDDFNPFMLVPPVGDSIDNLSESVLELDQEYTKYQNFSPVFSPSPMNKTFNFLKKNKAKDVSILKNDATYNHLYSSLENIQDQYNKIVEKFGPITPAVAIAWYDKEKYLYLGDDMGAIRCFDLKVLFEDLHVREDEFLAHSHVQTKDMCRRYDRIAKGYPELPSPRTLSYKKKYLTDSRANLLLGNLHENNDEYIYESNVRKLLKTSALPPYHKSYLRYLVNEIDDMSSYHGINFRFTLFAHQDRIISCKCIDYGFVTSSADRLVKVWTYQGIPLGSLLSSVPVGIKDSKWKLELNIKKAMEHEEEELKELKDNVNKIANDCDTANIETSDFTGMDPGPNAADFNRSELRRRIELSGKYLGLNFPKGDDQPLNSSNNVLSVSNSYIGSTVKTGDDESSLYSIDSYGSGLLSASSASKSVNDAMTELKSIHPGMDYQGKTQTLTYRQRRIRTVKMRQLSDHLVSSKTKGDVNSLLTAVENEEVIRKANELLPTYDLDSNEQLDVASNGLGDISFEGLLKLDDNSHSKNKYSLTSPKLNMSQNQKKSNISMSCRNFVKESERNTILLEKCSKYTSFEGLDKALTLLQTTGNQSGNKMFDNSRKYSLDKSKMNHLTSPVSILSSTGQQVVNEFKSTVSVSSNDSASGSYNTSLHSSRVSASRDESHFESIS